MAANEAVQERNMTLSFEFHRYLMEHPEAEDLVPDGATVVLLPDFDPELAAYNLELGRFAKAQGERVVTFRFERLKQITPSRLEGMVVAEDESIYGPQG